MGNSQFPQSQNAGPSPSGIGTGGMFGDAVRYWEPRRILYNVVLAAVIAGWLVLTWPHFRGAATSESLVFLIFLAVMANLCYSAVYLIDIPLASSPVRGAWQRWRWALWLIGLLIGVLFLNYWIADEIYPFVR